MGASVIFKKLYVSLPTAIITNPATSKMSPINSVFFDMFISSMSYKFNPLYTLK